MSEIEQVPQERITDLKRAWWAKWGRCDLCDLGNKPIHGEHIGSYGHKYPCKNNTSCVLCHNCLPPGEVCQSCYRKNVGDVES